MLVVVDASVLVTALVDERASGGTARAYLLGNDLTAPELIDLEVASVLRRSVGSGGLTANRARAALTDLAALPLRRVTHRGLLARCWDLRENVTIYDAAYVALAELLDVILVTADARLARAPGIRCEIAVLS